MVGPVIYIPSRRNGFRHVHKVSYCKQPGNPSIGRLRWSGISDHSVSTTRSCPRKLVHALVTSTISLARRKMTCAFHRHTVVERPVGLWSNSAERSMNLIREKRRSNPAPCLILYKIRSGLTKKFPCAFRKIAGALEYYDGGSLSCTAIKQPGFRF